MNNTNVPYSNPFIKCCTKSMKKGIGQYSIGMNIRQLLHCEKLEKPLNYVSKCIIVHVFPYV